MDRHYLEQEETKRGEKRREREKNPPQRGIVTIVSQGKVQLQIIMEMKEIAEPKVSFRRVSIKKEEMKGQASG